MGGIAMILRERLFVALAIAISLVLHAVVFGLVMNMQFDISRQRLFGSTTPDTRDYSVKRSSNDLILEDVTPTPTPLEVATALIDRDEINRLALERLERIVPEHIPQVQEPANAQSIAAGAQEPENAKILDPIEAPATRVIDPAALLDATLEMMRLAQPSIALPEYEAATDHLIAPPPVDVPVVPQEQIDIAKLDTIAALGSQPITVGKLLPDLVKPNVLSQTTTTQFTPPPINSTTPSAGAGTSNTARTGAATGGAPNPGGAGNTRGAGPAGQRGSRTGGKSVV